MNLHGTNKSMLNTRKDEGSTETTYCMTTNKSMLNTRKDEGSTETTYCMTDGDPWPVFGFGFMA